MVQLEQSQQHAMPKEWMDEALQVTQQALSSGAFAEGLHFARITVDHARQHNFNAELIRALTNLGHLLFVNQRLYDALEALTEASLLLESTQMLPEQARNDNLIGAVYQILGNLENAYFYYDRSLSTSRAIPDRNMEAKSLNNMALLLQQQLKYSDALLLIQQIEQMYREMNHPVDLCRTIINKIGIQLENPLVTPGRLEVAQEMQEAQNLLDQHDDVIQNIILLKYKAKYHCLFDELMAARIAASTALQLSEEHQFTDLTAHTHLIMGEILNQGGQPEDALEHLNAAIDLFRNLEYQESLLQAIEVMVQTLRQLKRFEEALNYHEEMLRLDREVRNEAASKQLELMAFQRKLEQSQHQAELERIRSEELELLVQERTAELESAYLEMLERLAIAAEFRDSDTGEHTVRVGERAAEVARFLGMPEERVRILRLAARLHDVGKIAISDTILHKPGKLTEDEYLTMKAHTLAGARMLSEARSELIRMAECIALTHHEKWDGTGYPHGLKGEEIPLEGRIVAVVDVLDALTSSRPYKHAWTMEEALQEIERQSGQHFDPQVVMALLNIHKNQS